MQTLLARMPFCPCRHSAENRKTAQERRIYSIFEGMELYQSRRGFVVKATIPGGTYTGYDEDILTLAHNGFLCATADFPENDAYLLTKTTFSNLDWLREAYAGLDCYATQNPYEAALSTGVPLHDGSLRALQELGLAQ